MREGTNQTPRKLFKRAGAFCKRQRHFVVGYALISRRTFTLAMFPRKRYLRVFSNPPARSSGQAKKATYVGGDGGSLSRDDFLRALEELEVYVGGWEAEALLDRFAAAEEDENDKANASHRLSVTAAVRLCLPFVCPAVTEQGAAHVHQTRNRTVDARV